MARSFPNQTALSSFYALENTIFHGMLKRMFLFCFPQEISPFISPIKIVFSDLNDFYINFIIFIPFKSRKNINIANQTSLYYSLIIYLFDIIFIHMNMKIQTFIVLLLTLILASSTSRLPSPFCSSKPLFKQTPLSPGELRSHDMSDAFVGYNLNITLASNNSFAKITPKFLELDRQNYFYPFIISHHVEHDGNTWGKQAYIMYSTNTSGGIHFTYAIRNESHHIPVFNFTVLISAEKNVRCFSAALFMEYGLAIVDCLHEKSGFSPFENHFYYVDLTTHTVTHTVPNDMYVSFREIKARKILKFKDSQTGYVYLLRAYEAQGVDEANRENTYMELFSARDPYKLEVLQLIDRTFIHAKTMSITDVKVYMNDIFFLDYLNGLYRLDVQRSQELAITGRYDKDGYYKFSVYSDNLQNQLLVALSNSHAVYEVDWSDTLDPILLNKYSLMEHSHVKQVVVNNRYLVVQSSANATDGTTQSEIDYTWIFTKGSRTYSNAYHIINHEGNSVEIQLDRLHDRLLTADSKGLALYQLDEARLKLQTDESKIGTSEEVILFAESTDPHTKETQKCQEKIIVNVIQATNQTIFPTDYPTTSTFSVNYPGQLHIGMNLYVQGPNITYDITNASHTPTYWINKRNKTNIHLPHDLNSVRFFHSQVIPEIGFENIIYFVGQYSKLFHIFECRHVWESADVFCREESEFNNPDVLEAFTTAYFTDKRGYKYFYVFVFKNTPNVVRVIDYEKGHKLIALITYDHAYDFVTEVASSNGYLYVLRSFKKTIDVYSLKKCQELEQCHIEFQIDAETLRSQIEYFSPQKIVTDFMHPEVLFIQCLGSILILDVDNHEKVTVLDEIVSPVLTNRWYRITVNEMRMVVVSDPDVIMEYSLEHLYSKNKVVYIKTLPMYGYSLTPNADVDFSSVQNTVYIKAVDDVKNISVILIYRTQMPAANALFDVVELPRRESVFEIQVSGFQVDFLNIMTSDDFQLYRIFESPSLAIHNSIDNLTFQLSFKNQKSQYKTDSISVEAIGIPQGFTPTPQLNKTLDGLELSSEQTYSWDDRKWFKGHITHYNYTCDDCSDADKVKVKEHVQQMNMLPISGYDYHETRHGGVSVYDDLFTFHKNGSINKVIHLPDQSLNERCHRIASNLQGQYLITACQHLGVGINLYMTTATSFKEWTWGPYRSGAYNVRRLWVTGDILMLTDTSTFPEQKFEKGRVFLYSIAFDKDTGEQFDELQIIEEDDLVDVTGYPGDEVYIGNSHLTFSQANNAYKLYLTEVDHGLFIVDFTYKVGRRQISIIKITFVELKELLHKNNLNLPTGASFQAVNLLGYKHHPHFDTESVLVTTKGYHNLELLISYQDGHFAAVNLHRLYLRYSLYNTANEAKTVPGYVAISYILPSSAQYSTPYTKQVIAVYDTVDYESESEKGYSERYMLGSFTRNKTQQSMFAFNTTYDTHSNGTRIGLVVTFPYEVSDKNMYETSLSKNLTAQIAAGVDSQSLTFIPYNDFESKEFSIPISGTGNTETVLTIIIIILAVGITAGFLFYIIYLIKNKKKPNQEKDRGSLLTEEETLRQTLVVTNNSNPQEGYVSDDEASQEEESGEESDEKQDEKEKAEEKVEEKEEQKEEQKEEKQQKEEKEEKKAQNEEEKGE